MTRHAASLTDQMNCFTDGKLNSGVLIVVEGFGVYDSLEDLGVYGGDLIHLDIVWGDHAEVLN